MRAVERGLGPEDLADLGRRRGRSDWVSAAEVLDEYVEVTSLATPGAYDPAGIVDAAANLLSADPALLACRAGALVSGRRRRRPGGDGRHAAAPGGARRGRRRRRTRRRPRRRDQTFRGARPSFLPGAASSWRRADGAPARTVVLRTVHRHGPLLRAVAARVAERIGSAGIPVQRQAVAGLRRATRGGRRARPRLGRRRRPRSSRTRCASANLTGGVGWGRMAVVVRSARRTETLRRALCRGRHPGRGACHGGARPGRTRGRALRRALACVLDPAALTPEVAAELLTGPSAVPTRSACAGCARRCGPGNSRAAGTGPATTSSWPACSTPRSWSRSTRARCVGPVGSRPSSPPGGRRRRSRARTRRPCCGNSGSPPAWRSRGAAGRSRGGASGARADRDLDAVVALFEAAARFVDRLPHAGPEAFLAYLEGQDVPGDTLAERAPDVRQRHARHSARRGRPGVGRRRDRRGAGGGVAGPAAA